VGKELGRYLRFKIEHEGLARMFVLHIQWRLLMILCFFSIDVSVGAMTGQVTDICLLLWSICKLYNDVSFQDPHISIQLFNKCTLD
jgi:hypothetical protein